MFKHFYKISLSICLLLFFASCANYRLHQSTAAKNIENTKPGSEQVIDHSIYFIGGTATTLPNPTLKLLKQKLSKAPKNTSVLFLGDNVSKMGMPSKSKVAARKTAEQELNTQLDILSEFKGQAIFIPGHTDWAKYGLKGLKRQEKYIQSALNKADQAEDDWADYFLPHSGCPGPEVVEINEQLVLIIIDSEWWITDWNKESAINNGCEVKTRAAFALLLEKAIKDNKNKNIVIASHHPIQTYGEHGGKYTLKDHLFPLTAVSENLYLPLPLVGTLSSFIRSTGGFSRQDLANRNYKSFRKAVLHAVEGKGEFIFVGGHEKSLQYIQEKGQHIIVSGAGTKKTATTKPTNAPFTYGKNGFSKIDFYEDGAAWLEFWTPDETGAAGKMVFRQQIKKALPKVSPADIPSSFPEYESKADSALQFAITTPVKAKTKYQTFMLGEHHQSVYLEKFKFPTLDLATFKGGLTVIKKGGGKQTNSLRFADPNGKEYVMRSLTKDESRSVPYPFNKMALVTTLFQDNFLGSHPFAPLAISTLADAAKVYHANPSIYYVPKQPALAHRNDIFGGEVYIVEERASKSWEESSSFGNASKFISTYDLSQKMEKNHHHQVDQNWVARSRIFDLLIGDFDRHDDQWRWAVTQVDEDLKEYRPIPRDRDQAFSKYDGFVVNLLSPYNALLRQLGDYDKPIEDFEWATFNSRFFDNSFLNELSLEEWIKEAEFIQQNMTDEVIQEAFSYFPARVYELSGPKIIASLKKRRAALPAIAAGFYRHLSKKVTVTGSEKREYFEVIRQDAAHTVVNMYTSNKKGAKKRRLYHRVFKTTETKEIYLYGLGGDDIFYLSGEVEKGITIRVVGGLGKDEFIDISKVKGVSKKSKFYDSIKGNKLQLNSESKDLTSSIAEHNIYDRLGFQHDQNTLIPFPQIGVNADDGFLIGFTGIYQKAAFNKIPYGQKHTFGINYAFATKGADLTYNGEFIGASKNWDLVVNAELRNSRYAYNFFGFGNETVQSIDDIEFYRVRQSLVYLDLGWQRRFAGDIGQFSIRPLIQSTKIENTSDRFISRDDSGLNAEDFERRWFGGLVTGLNFSSVDNEISPRFGFRFQSDLGWQSNLNGQDREFTTFDADFTLYKSFGNRVKTIFASRLGTALIRGDYDFFFAPTLGQKENIRGLFKERFRGATSVFHTTDIRQELGSSNNAILPFSFGLTASFDYGRVWNDGENSNLWHTSYGGGIWIVPLNLAVLSFTYNKSDVDTRFTIGLGHAF